MPFLGHTTLCEITAKRYFSLEKVVCPKKGTVCLVVKKTMSFLTAESVEGTALTLQSVDDIHGGDGLSLGVLGVGDSITDDVLQEYFEDTSSLFIDEAGNTFHASTASQSANGRLGNTLDIVTKHL